MLPEFWQLKLYNVLRKSWRTPENLNKHGILDNNFHFFFPSIKSTQLHDILLFHWPNGDKVYVWSRRNWATWCTIALLSPQGKSLFSFLLTFQSQYTTNNSYLEEDWGRLIEWIRSTIVFMAQRTIEFKCLPSWFDPYV